MWKTRDMDIKQLQINDSSYIEGTICLVNEWIGAKGMVFRSIAWPDRFFPFLFVVAEKKGLVWFTHTSRLRAPHGGGGVNRGNVIKT